MKPEVAICCSYFHSKVYGINNRLMVFRILGFELTGDLFHQLTTLTIPFAHD